MEKELRAHIDKIKEEQYRKARKLAEEIHGKDYDEAQLEFARIAVVLGAEYYEEE